MTRFVRVFAFTVLLSLVGWAQEAVTVLPPAHEDVTDRGRMDTARSVSVNNDVSVTAILSQASDGGLNLIVKGSNAETADEIWNDQIVAAPHIVTDVYTAVDGDRAFVAGYVPGNYPSTSNIIVLAYDLQKGTKLWEYVWGPGNDNMPKGIVAANGIVAVIGTGGAVNAGEASHGLIKALNQVTGQPRWTSIVDTALYGNSIVAVDTDGANIATAGAQQVTAKKDLVLRIQDLQTGALLWQATRTNTQPNAVKLSGGMVMVAGGEASKTFFAGYNLTTGQIAWTDPSVSGNFTALDANDTQVVAAGRAGTSGYAKSVDPQSGTEMWVNKSAAVANVIENFRKVKLTEKSAYMAGSVQQSLYPGTPSTTEWLVRAVDGAGAVVAEDRSHRGSGTGNALLDISISGGRLVAAGSKQGATQDAVSRAVDVSSVESRPGGRE